MGYGKSLREIQAFLRNSPIVLSPAWLARPAEVGKPLFRCPVLVALQSGLSYYHRLFKKHLFRRARSAVKISVFSGVLAPSPSPMVAPQRPRILGPQCWVEPTEELDHRDPSELELSKEGSEVTVIPHKLFIQEKATGSPF